jgi:hypothetical protein
LDDFDVLLRPFVLLQVRRRVTDRAVVYPSVGGSVGLVVVAVANIAAKGTPVVNLSDNL